MSIITKIDRKIGSYKGDSGNLVIVTAGMHGNEQSGIFALQRIFSHLHNRKPKFNGELLGLAGNLPSIEANKRFDTIDFNRIWKPDTISRVQTYGAKNVEEEQLIKLLGEINHAIKAHKAENVVYIDLHNTSSSKGLFTITFNRKDNIQIASAVGIPIVTGLAKELSGTAIEYMSNLGYSSIAFEGGELGKESSITIHEAGIWMLLNSTGCIAVQDIPDYHKHKQFLDNTATNFPKVTNLVYVHKINEEHDFEMQPGYKNFQRIEAGELLAHDKNGEILAPKSGYILMPLYQKQGGEGFFIIEDLEGF